MDSDKVACQVESPIKNRFIGSFYDSNEVEKLFEAAKGTRLEMPIFLGAFYGLRRSEVLGLKWSAIDFQSNTITIKHTIISCNIDGKHIRFHDPRHSCTSLLLANGHTD